MHYRTPRTRNRFAKIVLVGCLFMLLAVTGIVNTGVVNAQTWEESVGYDRLIAELGVIEDGTGIVLSMTEADTNADPLLFRYMIPMIGGKNVVDGSGLNNDGNSGHATTIARTFFHDISIAQGATDMTVYEANDYIDRVLGRGTGTDPLVQTSIVQNHSWVGDFGNLPGEIAAAENTLQRLDYMINRDGVTVAVGLNNGNAPHRQLLGQSYNAISVGRVDGNHSQGQTTVYGVGRLKPEIVTLSTSTSVATARVSSVLAILHEKAVNDGNPDASRPEMMKAIVMAGARKSSVPGWTRTSTQPLDEVFGAGELNIYNSYKILDAGETDGSLTVPTEGTIDWVGFDYGEMLAGGDSIYYNLDIDAADGLKDFSMLLTWNIDIEDGDPGALFDPVSTLADMSLRLYDSTGTPLGSLVDSSVATVGNVEHIFLETIGPGLYTIEISTDIDTEFGFAWYSVPEPGSIAFLMISGLLLSTRRRRS